LLKVQTGDVTIESVKPKSAHKRSKKRAALVDGENVSHTTEVGESTVKSRSSSAREQRSLNKSQENGKSSNMDEITKTSKTNYSEIIRLADSSELKDFKSKLYTERAKFLSTGRVSDIGHGVAEPVVESSNKNKQVENIEPLNNSEIKIPLKVTSPTGKTTRSSRAPLDIEIGIATLVEPGTQDMHKVEPARNRKSRSPIKKGKTVLQSVSMQNHSHDDAFKQKLEPTASDTGLTVIRKVPPEDIETVLNHSNSKTMPGDVKLLQSEPPTTTDNISDIIQKEQHLTSSTEPVPETVIAKKRISRKSPSDQAKDHTTVETVESPRNKKKKSKKPTKSSDKENRLADSEQLNETGTLSLLEPRKQNTERSSLPGGDWLDEPSKSAPSSPTNSHSVAVPNIKVESPTKVYHTDAGYLSELHGSLPTLAVLDDSAG